MNYPKELIATYKQGKITRKQFIFLFNQWQKTQGMNFDVKMRADKENTYLIYRNVKANIRGDFIYFSAKPKITESATSIFEFCRKVDFSKNASVL